MCEWMLTGRVSFDEICQLVEDAPVSLCHANADRMSGMGPVLAWRGMKRLIHLQRRLSPKAEGESSTYYPVTTCSLFRHTTGRSSY